MLAAHLSRLATEYTYARAKPFPGSPFADFVRHDIAIAAKDLLNPNPDDLRVKASVGRSDWAAVPWLGFFDPLITDTATQGFYVVCLINPDAQTITLSLNQGTVAIYREFGPTRGRDVLRRRARDMADRVPDFAKRFSEAPIDLSSQAGLPAGYEAGHAFGKTYPADQLAGAEFVPDLHDMLGAYDMLIRRGGTTPMEVMEEQAKGRDLEETRHAVLSRRIEQSPHVRKAVLAATPPICACCGLDPKRDYGYDGRREDIPLGVHYCAPPAADTRRYSVPDDFLLLCPSCHAMIHTQDDPSDLSALQARLRFKIARAVSSADL